MRGRACWAWVPAAREFAADRVSRTTLNVGHALLFHLSYTRLSPWTPIRTVCKTRSGRRPVSRLAVRDVRRAGAQAQAPTLRGLYAEGAPRAWSPRDRGRAQGSRRPGRSGQRSAPQRCRKPCARRGDQAKGIAVIATGRASTPLTAMLRGSNARSRRSSTPFRSRRSARPRAFHSRPARASEPGRASRTRGIGRHSSRSFLRQKADRPGDSARDSERISPVVR